MSENGVIINNFKVEGTMSAKEMKSTYGNYQVKINTDKDILIKDCVFNQPGYNCFEIGHDVPAKNITIKNCKFGDLVNNTILIFGTQNDVTINIINCEFGIVSNPIRLSNNTNAKNVTVNIIDCDVKQWEQARENFSGLICLQDYTSKDNEEALSANRFSPDKITFNIKNLTHKGIKVKAPSLVNDIWATKTKSQLGFIYIDNATIHEPSYDPAKFPKITITE